LNERNNKENIMWRARCRSTVNSGKAVYNRC
jgi:hypothetical protein